MSWVPGAVKATAEGGKQVLNAKMRATISPMLTAIFMAVGLLAVAPSGSAQTAAQASFSSPQDALQALAVAAKAKDRSAFAKLYGPEYEQLLSGDEVEDAKDLEDFAAAVNETVALQQVSKSKFTVAVGSDGWPSPIPVVEKDGKWWFDTKAGLDELLNRRVGENELSAIATCRAYAVAQWEYYTEGDWDHDGVAEYAQKLISTPGQHDGLYWETAEGDKPSPLGKLIAAARAEGYGPKAERPDASGKGGSEKEADAEERAPYHGYYFKILMRQGAHAPGGRYGYIINGNMIAGYALVAYPDKWGSSGVMTFIVNQQGRVYQKNLGAETTKLAGAMTEYNPDPSWKMFAGDQP